MSVFWFLYSALPVDGQSVSAYFNIFGKKNLYGEYIDLWCNTKGIFLITI